MFAKNLARFIVAASVLVCAVAWAAVPSVDQVYQVARAGNYAQAQGMMDQVLREHPNSAKAHFIQAELLARQGKLAAARGELDTAQKLDPALAFAKPQAVQELKTLLAGNNGGSGSAAGSGGVQVRPGGGQGLPWGGIVLVVAVVALVMFLRRTFGRRTGGYGPASGALMPGGPAGPAGYGPGGAAMTPPAAGGMGSGLLGGLATGAAVGAGMVAGQALMNRVFEGGSHNTTALADDAAASAPPPGVASYDMGGNDFGVNDAGSWDSGGAGDSWDSGGGGDDSWS